MIVMISSSIRASEHLRGARCDASLSPSFDVWGKMASAAGVYGKFERPFRVPRSVSGVDVYFLVQMVRVVVLFNLVVGECSSGEGVRGSVVLDRQV